MVLARNDPFSKIAPTGIEVGVALGEGYRVEAMTLMAAATAAMREWGDEGASSLMMVLVAATALAATVMIAAVLITRRKGPRRTK